MLTRSNLDEGDAIIDASPFVYYANKRTVRVQQIAASPAANEAGTICVLTWSIRSEPVHMALKTVVSEIGEHWSP